MHINYDYIKQISKSSAWLPTLVIAGFLLFTMPAWAQNVTVTYTTPGSNYSIIVPANATNVTGEAWGGGGGGGGTYSGGSCLASAGGGGGGAYIKKTYPPGASLSMTVGAGGAGGDNANGAAGSSSTIIYNSSTATAGGGHGGTRSECNGSNNTNGTGGAGGTPSGGDVNSSGGKGYSYNEDPASSGGFSPNGGGITGSPGSGKDAIPGISPGGGGSGAQDRSVFLWYDTKQGAKGANGQVKITFTLKPTFEISSLVCSGQNVTFTITNYEAEGTYSLYNGTTHIHTFTGNSFTTTAVAGSYTVRLQRTITHSGGTLSTSDGATNNGDEVTVNSDAQSVTVNPTPTITTQDFTVCSGEAFSFGAAQFTGSNTIPTGTTFSWSAPTVNSDISGTPTTAATDQSAIAGTLTNSTNADIPDAVTYSVTPTAPSGCVGNSFTVTIQVRTVPDITSPIHLGDVCSGYNLDFTPQNGTHGIVTSNTEYKWTVTHSTNISPISNQPNYQSAITQTNITNTGTAPETVTFTVTYRRSTGGHCTTIEKSFTLTLTVHPTPTFTVTQPAAVCSLETVDLSATVSDVTPLGSTVSYYDDYAAGYLLDPLTGTDITDRSVAGTDYIQVTSQAGCKSAVQEVTVIINPLPVISGTNSVCVGKTTELSANLPDGDWTLSQTGIATIVSTSGLVTGVTAGTVNAIYTVTATGCANTHAITVKPTPIIETPSTTAFCAGEEYDFDLNAATDFLTGGTWSFTATPIASTINDISGEFTAGDISFAQSPATLNIQYTIDGCASNHVAITVKHRPAAPVTQNVSQCKDESSTEPIVWLNKVQLASEGLPAHTWYSTYPGTALPSEPAPVSVNSNFNGTCYITQTINGCESNAASLSIVVSGVSNIEDILIYNECRTLSGPASIDIMGINNGQLVPPAGTDLQFYDAPAGGIYVTQPSTTFDPQIAGTTEWYAKQITASSSCESNIFTITAIVKALPTATIGAKAVDYSTNPASEQGHEICIGESWDLQVDFPGQTGSFAYTYTDGHTTYNQPSTSDNPSFNTVSPATTTTYTLTYVEDITTGCSVSDASFITGSAAITVHPLPSVSLSPTELCKGSEVTLTFSNGILPIELIYTINGIDTDTITVNSTPLNLILDTAGILDFTVILLTDANGCAALPITKTITVKDRPTVTETLALTPICEGTSFNIETMVGHYLATDYHHGTAQPSYWIIAQSAGGADPYTLAYNNLPDSYTPVYLTDNNKWIGLVAKNECGTDTVLAQLKVKQLPVVHALTTSVCSGIPIDLTPTNGQNNDIIPVGTTFAWDRGDIPTNIGGTTNTWGSGVTDAAWQSTFSQTLTNSANTATDMIYYLYANNQGCVTAKADYTVTVHPLPTVEVVADNNAIIIDEHGMMQICEDKSYKFILVGTPPFTLTYTVNGEDPSYYNLDTVFNTSNTTYNSTTKNYTSTLPVLSPGIYNFAFTKIEDNKCVSEK